MTHYRLTVSHAADRLRPTASGGLVLMMQLQATSLGEAVPRGNFEARIHSVFEGAVNLQLATEDRLLTVLVAEDYQLPQGIHLAPPAPAFQALTVGRGAAVRGGLLRFEATPWAIDLRGAPIWQSHLPELNLNLEQPSVQTAWQTAWDVLNHTQRLQATALIADDLCRTEGGSALSQKLREPVAQLVTATARMDAPTALRAAEKIIGLGPGVTPSGDDLLLGFLAGLWSRAGLGSPALAFISIFGSALLRLAAQTTDISRTYLYHATQGQFSSRLVRLVEALAAGRDVNHAARRAMHIGHSSGMDTVTGLLLGLKAWPAESSFV